MWARVRGHTAQVTIELEAVEETDEYRWVDPLDATGHRCDARHDDVGSCVRRFDHVTRGDGWHYAMTNYDPTTRTRQVWRWRDV